MLRKSKSLNGRNNRHKSHQRIRFADVIVHHSYHNRVFRTGIRRIPACQLFQSSLPDPSFAEA